MTEPVARAVSINADVSNDVPLIHRHDLFINDEEFFGMDLIVDINSAANSIKRTHSRPASKACQEKAKGSISEMLANIDKLKVDIDREEIYLNANDT